MACWKIVIIIMIIIINAILMIIMLASVLWTSLNALAQ